MEPEETPTGCAEASSPEGAPAPVSLRDTLFEPNCLAVSSTQTFTLANTGHLLHNFSIRDTDVDIDVQPGEEVETEQIRTSSWEPTSSSESSTRTGAWSAS